MAEQRNEIVLNKDFLINNAKFLEDAQIFLAEREDKDLSSPEEIYDAFMEHFRYQNVNEVTAARDLYYVNNQTDDEGRLRMGRLMDTYDRMDSDFGLAAAQDYLGGVFTAPSTYAGMFSFGAGKAGALAAQQGVKLGIREVVKNAAKRAGKKVTKKQLDDVAFDTTRRRVSRRLKGEQPVHVSLSQRASNIGRGITSGGYKAGVGAAAVETIGAGAGVTAQEMIRVETIDGYEDISLANIGLATGLSAITGGVLGTLSGAQKTIRSNVAEQYVIKELSKQKRLIETAYKTKTRPLFNSKTYGKIAKENEEMLKLSLKETTEGAIAEGERVKKKLTGTRRKAYTRYENLTTSLQQMEIKNIAAAATEVLKKIGPRPGVVKGSKEDAQERITSRIARGLKENKITTDGMLKIMQDHGITLDQFSSFYVADISEAAAKLGTQGRLAREQAKKFKESLTQIDKSLIDLGARTESAYVKVKELDKGYFNLTAVGNFITALNKTRIGFMTVQAATTVRNTTNGLLRNHLYALENLGTGSYNLVKGGFQKFGSATDKELKAVADLSVKTGIAQLRAGGKGLFFDDMFFGMQSQETAILTRMLRDPRLGNSNQAQELFRELGDIAQLSGVETSPLLRAARFANTFNTMSDNMFKSAIFAREIDKMIAIDPDDIFKKAGINGLDDLMKREKFGFIGEKAIARAMDEALDFTYQTGKFKGREGQFNKFADWFIEATSTTFGSAIVPFPRYLINQFRFVYEHAPVFGMLNIGGILNKTGGGSSTIADRFGKQMTGYATIAAFFAMRVHMGDESTKFYEYKDPTSGGVVSAKAALGPFMAYAYIADMLYRMGKPGGYLQKELGLPALHSNDRVALEKVNTREMVEALTGSQFRAGTGLELIDGTVKALLGETAEAKSSDKGYAAAAKFLGNYVSSFTVGAGMIKDIYAQYDPAYVNVPVNEDINFFPYLFKQATRSLPIASDGSDPFLYSPLAPRESMQTTTKSIPLRNVNPILKQLTGLTFEERRNYAEKELNRLQFDWVEVAPRKTLDPLIDNEAKAELGSHIERVLSNEVVSPDYQLIDGDTKKRLYLRAIVQGIKSDAVNLASNYDSDDTPEEVQRKNRVRYYREIPSNIRKIMEQDYDGEAGHADFSETQDFTEMLDRYYSEDTGYKDQLSRDQLIKRYMRQMELY
jgi:hypothetical protein